MDILQTQNLVLTHLLSKIPIFWPVFEIQLRTGMKPNSELLKICATSPKSPFSKKYCLENRDFRDEFLGKT